MRAPVLHVIPFLWSGAGAVVTRLCESQARHGPVAIVTSGRRGAESDWPTYRRRLASAGVTHHTIDVFTRDAPRVWAAVTALETLVRLLRPAVVHAHAGLPCAAAVSARDIAGVPTRIIGQMYSWGVGRPSWMNVQDGWAFARADAVVCSAHAYGDLLVQHGVPRNRITYLPWGLPLDSLPQRLDPRRALTPETRLTLGFVGRIEPRKGQLHLVQALAVLRDTFPMARLELVGPVADEAYAARLDDAIRDLGLDEAVRLSGRVRNPARRMSRWDVFVSASTDEGQGLAVLEAMALGVPVVARRVAGIDDFLDDGVTGFEVRGGSPRAIARAVVHAARSPVRQRVVTSARRMVEARYAWDDTVRAFERLYRRG